MYSAGNLGVNGVVSGAKVLTIAVDWPPRHLEDQAGVC